MQAPPVTRPALVPATSTRLNATPTASTKRKRDEAEQESNSGINIVARSFMTSVSPSSAIFRPVVTVAKADLPLVWLDTTLQPDVLASGYLFESAGSVLQILAPKQAMVARLCPNGRLYALEKVQDNVYTAMLLSVWVTEHHCRTAAVGAAVTVDMAVLQSESTDRREQHKRNGSVSSISSIRPPTPLSPKQPKNRKGALARKSILTPKESQEAKAPLEPESTKYVDSSQDTAIVSLPLVEPTQPVVQPEDESNADVVSQHQEGLAHPPVSMEAIEAAQVDGPPPPAQSPADEIHCQYLEALYARTSLAFYAKGPLGRARGMIKENTARLTVEELNELYTSLVLPSKKMDTKYKESLPVFLKHLTVPLGDPEQKRKRSSKKVKLGKDCLYSCEHDLLRKCWDELSLSSTDTPFDTQVRKYIEDLRNREAEMQLLLILEIMILGTMKEVAAPSNVPVDPEIKIESVEQDNLEIPAKSEKKRRKRDFSSEMDALLDRLCIWHTITLDDFLISPEKTSNSSTTQNSKDKLKEFCTDIIVPFYASKLPEQVKNICKKLGGPNISPQRPKLARSRSVSGQKSTAHLTGKTTSTAKTSLQRVLSQDQELRHSSPPVPSRSSFGHQRSGSTLKREPSEVLSRPSSRAGMQKSASFSNREIDLVADARMQETKRRKLEKVADQKRELASAIEALKKPNRSNVAKAIMDEAEKRVEPKLQITATPRKGRAQSTHLNSTQPDFHQREPEIEPLIPSSTLRPPPTSLNNLAQPSARKRAVLSAIHDTPSRGQEHRTSDPLRLSSAMPATSHASSYSSNPHATLITATPSTNRLRPHDGTMPLDTPLQLKMTHSGKPVLFTPLKGTDISIEDAFKDAPEIPERAGMAMDRAMGGKGREMFGRRHDGTAVATTTTTASTSGAGLSGSTTANSEKSLYAQLGWDDDDDLGDI